MVKLTLTEEEQSFRMSCPKTGMNLRDGPVTCRVCDQKKTCKQVQSLLSAKREYMEKFKGTIMESAMRRVSEKKENVARFILDGIFE